MRRPGVCLGYGNSPQRFLPPPLARRKATSRASGSLRRRSRLRNQFWSSAASGPQKRRRCRDSTEMRLACVTGPLAWPGRIVVRRPDAPVGTVRGRGSRCFVLLPVILRRRPSVGVSGRPKCTSYNVHPSREPFPTDSERPLPPRDASRPRTVPRSRQLLREGISGREPPTDARKPAGETCIAVSACP